MSTNAPIVIGGCGGSGTRLAVEMLRRAGVFMGHHLNESLDAMHFVPFLEEKIPAILSETKRLDYALPAHVTPWLETLQSLALQHLGGQTPARWGWKNPRSIYILPLILEIYPEMRFIHIIRDGRRMALSSNQNQTNLYYPLLFGEDSLALPLRALRLWARVNEEVAEWGTRELSERYTRVRYEDLLSEEGAAQMLRPLGLAAAPSAGSLIRPPKEEMRIEDWKALLRGHGDLVERALVRFGYA